METLCICTKYLQPPDPKFSPYSLSIKNLVSLISGRWRVCYRRGLPRLVLTPNMKPTSSRTVEDKHGCPLAPDRSPTRGSRCHKRNSEPDQGQSSPQYCITSALPRRHRSNCCVLNQFCWWLVQKKLARRHKLRELSVSLPTDLGKFVSCNDLTGQGTEILTTKDMLSCSALGYF